MVRVRFAPRDVERIRPRLRKYVGTVMDVRFCGFVEQDGGSKVYELPTDVAENSDCFWVVEDDLQFLEKISWKPRYLH